MYDSDLGTLYRLVVNDISTGKRKPVPTAPIRGRRTAQAQLERIRRANHDPRMQYELERSQDISQLEGSDSSVR